MIGRLKEWLRCCWPGLVVGLVIVGLYHPMLRDVPVLDDPSQINYVRTLNSWSDCFRLDSVGWFRPFKNLVFYLTVDEHGGVFYTKLVCLLLFLMNIQLMYALLLLLFSSKKSAALGTALFALNPTMVSSVQFLSASNNQISFGFYLLFLYLSFLYINREGCRAGLVQCRVLFFGSLCALVLSLSSYEAAITCAGAFLILSVARVGWRSALRGRSGLVFSAAVALTLAYLLVRSGASANDSFNSPSLPPSASAVDLILRAPYYTWEHLLLWLDPWGRGGVLLDDDPRGLVWQGLLTWLVLSMIVVLSLWALATRLRMLSTGILLFLGAMLPLSNYLGLANGPICNYYLLFPSLGLVIWLTALLRLMLNMKSTSLRWLFGLVSACFLFGYATETYARVFAWRSPIGLEVLTLENYPKNYYHLTNNALRAVDNGDYEIAESMLNDVLRMAPWHWWAADRLAYLYECQDQPERAIAYLKSYHLSSERYIWKTHLRLGEIYVRLGRYQEANELLPRLLKVETPAVDVGRLYLQVAVPCLITYGREADAYAVLMSIEEDCQSNEGWSRLRISLLKTLGYDAFGRLIEPSVDSEGIYL